jgi:hypothetical protein
VLFLSRLWQEFGVDGASDPWLGGLHDVVSKHISQMGSAEDLVSEGLQDGFSPDWVERNWHRLYNHKAPNGNRLPPWLRSGHVFLMAVLLGEHGEVARSLVTWCANYSRRGTFLFYEPRDTGRFLASSVAEVNDRCRRVAERLTFGHQVVLDEDRRVIAAASMCRDMRRPAYPTARILHSLFYSDLGTQGQKTETSDSASVAGAGERRRS